LQYLYGLAKAQSDQVDVLFERILQQAKAPEVEQDRELWQSIGIPAARGVLAHAREEHHLAAECLVARIPMAVQPMGGCAKATVDTAAVRAAQSRDPATAEPTSNSVQ